MQIKNHDIKDTIGWLQATLKASGLSQEHISEATGVHQSQISRILSGQARRLSKNIVTLCKFAEDLHKRGNSAENIPAVLCNALLQTWDGSEEHAEAISKVILSLRGLSVDHERT